MCTSLAKVSKHHLPFHHSCWPPAPAAPGLRLSAGGGRGGALQKRQPGAVRAGACRSGRGRPVCWLAAASLRAASRCVPALSWPVLHACSPALPPTAFHALPCPYAPPRSRDSGPLALGPPAPGRRRPPVLPARPVHQRHAGAAPRHRLRHGKSAARSAAPCVAWLTVAMRVAVIEGGGGPSLRTLHLLPCCPC